jgi:hypothetical protein
MRYNIIDKNIMRVYAKWLCYIAVLTFLYMLMVGGWFRDWQPILIIPLCIAVSMRECAKPLSVSFFAAFCGLTIDSASANLFGFSGFWLLPGCLTACLLCEHLIKANLLNFLWLNAAQCIVMAAADYFFNYAIWNIPGHTYILTDFIIPAYLAAILFSPALYYAVRVLFRKFTVYERIRPYSHESNDEDYK